MQLCSEQPPGAKPSALASWAPCTRPMNSLATLRWNHGGRNVSCATSQRGGKIAKSMFAVPGTSLGEVSPVKIDRKRAVYGKNVSLRVDLERSRPHHQKNHPKSHNTKPQHQHTTNPTT